MFFYVHDPVFTLLGLFAALSLREKGPVPQKDRSLSSERKITF